MDDLDRAEQLESAMREASIAKIRSQAAPIPENNSGECWTCGEPVPDKRRWCCSPCRDEYLSTNN